MPRKLIVCLDGTGNEIEKNESNILRLYKCLKHSEQQRVYYEPGVGTLNTRPFARVLWEKPALLAGLVFGRGLEANVLRSYDFLCRNYRDGDQLYFFGYSRGAYTARVLAGFINQFGLVAPHELHLIKPVFRAYRRISEGDPRESYAKLRVCQQFFHLTHPPIRFLGLWDTVSSMLRFRFGKGTFVEYGTHADVDENPSVKSVRHALSIDETRRFFRQQLWTEGQPYHGNRFRQKSDPPPQDVKQVWFSGTHTDVAGSVAEKEAGLAKITMEWMRAELDGLGEDALEFRAQYYDRYVRGQEDEITRRMGLEISPPDPAAPLHSQMKKGWFLLEAFPRLVRRSDWPGQAGKFGYYIPWGQYRYIPPGSEIHPSVEQRRTALGADYDPPNLPK